MVTAQMKVGGLYRLKTKEELNTHQGTDEEGYLKLKICPSGHDEYRMLASFVQNFLKKFGIGELKFRGPDEWSQYLNIEFNDNPQDKNEIINLINSLGFWACLDGDDGVIDLADVDLNILKFVFPSQSFSFKTEPIQQKFSDSVTPQHFHLGMLQDREFPSKNGDEEPEQKKSVVPRQKSTETILVIPKEKEPEKKVTPTTNGHKVLLFEDLLGTEDLSLPVSFKPRKGTEISESGSFSLSKTFWKWEKSFNSRNLASGIESFEILNLRNEKTRQAFGDALPREHRRELFMTIEGVEYWNDSRATNVNAVWFTLEMTQKPIIWIAGGQDKGNDYDPIFELVREKVTSLICLGADTSRIAKVFREIVPEITQVSSMIQAVEVAYQKAKPGNTVLLSPACASFDLFENYEDRGRQFKEAVRAL